MRRVILFNLMSLDGFFAGPNEDIDWHNVDEEFNQFAIEHTATAGALLFGRITYELMAAYWPTPQAMADDPVIAGLMNSLPKVVFSKTLQKAEWNNTRLVKDNIPTEIAKLKQQSGKDLFIFGSADLSSSLIRDDLIDEYRIMVNPVILGAGDPLFQNIRQRIRLKLTDSRIFRSGNVLLYYQPDR